MSKRLLSPAHHDKLIWRIPTNAKFVLPVLFLFFHQAIHAAVFTSITNGNWTSGSTWAGGVAPGSTIAAADIVNIGHVVTYNSSNDLEVFGTVNIINGTFRTAL